MKTKVAVIGSNCFTGSHIVDAFVNRPHCDVIGISRSPERSALYLPYKKRANSNYKFFQFDLLSDRARLFKLLADYRPDLVINVAALTEVYQSHLTPSEYFETNTNSVVALAKWLEQEGWLKRFIQISSAEVYGPCGYPVSESAPLNPTTPYAVSKAAADQYLLTVANNSALPMTLIRSTNVYGPYQQLYKIIPRAVIRLKSHQKIELHGGGRVVRPFIHIRDVVSGILKVVDHPSPDTIYNFSTPDTHMISDIVAQLCEAMGKNFSEVTECVDQRPKQDSSYLLDTTKAERDLGWSPKISLGSGLDEVIDWITTHWKQVQREPQSYVHGINGLGKKTPTLPILVENDPAVDCWEA